MGADLSMMHPPASDRFIVLLTPGGMVAAYRYQSDRIYTYADENWVKVYGGSAGDLKPAALMNLLAGVRVPFFRLSTNVRFDVHVDVKKMKGWLKDRGPLPVLR